MFGKYVYILEKKTKPMQEPQLFLNYSYSMVECIAID